MRGPEALGSQYLNRCTRVSLWASTKFMPMAMQARPFHCSGPQSQMATSIQLRSC